ncbi:hypothetical protein JTE90_027583 [Oedothorax gibbosus]|uniref:Uncharacterized protein n=1 Tax=Oedothorax gibbosus TaxID=931172 RepID=A0AAV6VMT8_9ARAC|nr:hypothetical protein JTE90_027583 [Oedothorax gibbosus]
MKSLVFTFAMTALMLYLIPESSAELLKRCESVCSRSDGQDFCQRCRMRVPMRFGKRVVPTNDVPSQKKGMRQLAGEAEEEDNNSGYEDSGSQESGSNANVREEARFLLGSMKNFARDLENWNNEVYDQ